MQLYIYIIEPFLCLPSIIASFQQFEYHWSRFNLFPDARQDYIPQPPIKSPLCTRHESGTSERARQIPPADRVLKPAQTVQYKAEDVVDETKLESRSPAQYAGLRQDGSELHDRYRALGVSVPETESAASRSN